MSRFRFKSLFQWRLRTLLILITLFAAGLAIWLRTVEPYRTQTRILEQIEDANGHVSFAVAEPAWLGIIVGHDQFKRVVQYRVEGPEVDDVTLAPIVKLPFLERLYVNKTHVGDELAARLFRLEHLQRLSLWRTRITDEGLADIGKCSELRVLDIHETCVTDAGLAALKPLVKLRQLKLGGPVCGPGLRHIAKLPQLNRLDLSTTRVGYDDLKLLAGSPVAYLNLDSKLPASAAADLSKLPNLREYGAILFEADDETAKALTRCRQLERVQISGVGVTDTTIEMLVELPRLRFLLVEGNLTDRSLSTITTAKQIETVHLSGRFSRAAVEQFMRQRPDIGGDISVPFDTQYPIPALPKGKLTLYPLIVEHAPRGFGVMWPAKLGDAAKIEFSYPIKRILFDDPERLWNGLQNTQRHAWSLAGLDSYPDVEELYLRSVEPRDWELVVGAKRLKKLVLVDSQLTDADLKSVQLPPSLREFYIAPCMTTHDGLSRLRARYPQIEIRAGGHGKIFNGNRWQSPSISQGSVLVAASNPAVNDVELNGVTVPLNLDPLSKLPNLHSLELTGLHRTGRKYPGRTLWQLSKPLPELRNLHLLRYAMTDREIRQLQYLPKLETLYARASCISDEGFRQFAHTPNLRILVIGDSAFTPSGPWLTGRTLDTLSACPQLEELDLQGAPIRGKYLALLRNNLKLKEIDLSGTSVGDEGCAALAMLPNLQQLDLESTNIGDAGVQELAKSPSLQYLYLHRTNVTDDGLRHLQRCKTLRTVSLQGTRTTPQGRQTLRAAIPGVNVSP